MRTQKSYPETNLNALQGKEWENEPAGIANRALGRSLQSRGPESRDLKKKPTRRAPWKQAGERE